MISMTPRHRIARGFMGGWLFLVGAIVLSPSASVTRAQDGAAPAQAGAAPGMPGPGAMPGMPGPGAMPAGAPAQAAPTPAAAASPAQAAKSFLTSSTGGMPWQVGAMFTAFWVLMAAEIAIISKPSSRLDKPKKQQDIADAE
jgi:hypothetical protein